MRLHALVRSCSVCASLGALLLLPRSEEMQTDAL